MFTRGGRGRACGTSAMAFYILLQGVLLHSLLSNLDTNLATCFRCRQLVPCVLLSLS